MEAQLRIQIIQIKVQFCAKCYFNCPIILMSFFFFWLRGDVKCL